jgi:hypothetical protein
LVITEKEQMNRQCDNQKKKNKKTDNAITKGKRTKEQTM